MRRTNPDSLRSSILFPHFRLNFASHFFDLLVVRFYLVEIIIVKHLINNNNYETWLVVEPSTLRSRLS